MRGHAVHAVSANVCLQLIETRARNLFDSSGPAANIVHGLATFLFRCKVVKFQLDTTVNVKLTARIYFKRYLFVQFR